VFIGARELFSLEPSILFWNKKRKRIIELFQKCHQEHPIAKFWGECTDLKLKLDQCFRQEKAIKRKANFEESKRFKERLRANKAAMDASNLESSSPSQAAE